MRGWGGLIAFIIVLLCTPPVHAETTYAPGTIGYMADDCREVVKSQNPDIIARSWCMSFLQGHLWGFFMAAMKNHHTPHGSELQIKPECQETVKHEKEEIISGHLCSPGKHILLPTHSLQVFLQWIEWQKINDPNSLNSTLVPNFNEIFLKGDFCNDLITYKISRQFSIPVWLERKITYTLEHDKAFINIDRHLQCHRDEPFKSMNSQEFLKSNCGATTLGFSAGLYSTNVPLSPIPENTSCGEEIKYTRRHHITAQDLCFPPEVAPERVREFVNNEKECPLDE